MKRWEAWTNHVGWGLVAASGIVYGILKYAVATPDPDSRLAQPWQPAILAVHVLAAPVAVFALGLLFRRHALKRLASGFRDGRASGMILVLASVPLILSGYALQVVVGTGARRWTGWTHAAIGVLVTGAYIFHPRRSAFPNDSAESASEAESDVA
jgi:hypothetical protein